MLHSESSVGVVVLIRTFDSNGDTSDSRQFSFYCTRLVDSCVSVYGDKTAAFRPFRSVEMLSISKAPTTGPTFMPSALPTETPTSPTEVPTGLPTTMNYTRKPTAVPIPLPTMLPTPAPQPGISIGLRSSSPVRVSENGRLVSNFTVHLMTAPLSRVWVKFASEYGHGT